MTMPEDFDSAAQSGTSPLASLKLGMHPLIQLRWLAVCGQIATITFVTYVLEMDLPLMPMVTILLTQVGFNLLSMVHWRQFEDVPTSALFFALLIDVSTLTALLYLSGGAGNPFIFLFLLQVVLGAVLLDRWQCWTLVVITSASVTALILWPGPIRIPPNYYLKGLLVCFVLNAALLVVFITRINQMIRGRDARLAALRQRAVEEEHIVRMGLLASGAAHELGTPMATLSVILNDWRHLPQIASQPELLQDLSDMELQLERCKTIVSGILLSAGEVRAESLMRTSINDFLDTLIADWRLTRPVKDFDYLKRITDDLTIVSDEGLKQSLCNVLDNALEASPDWISFEAVRDDDDLVLRVIDRGPGFAETILAHFGHPYQSTKGRPGSGLGLFLTVNVTRALGGTITARNREQNGAVVTLRLPLSSLTLEPPMEESMTDER